MKKILAVLLTATVLLAGCGKEKVETKNEKNTAFPKGDKCDFLINANWEGNDTQCVNVINFKKDKGFSNWCYCGTPVGDADLVEGFSYNDKDKTVTLYDDEGKEYEKGKILYCDERYLIIDIWNRAYMYENLDSVRPEVFQSAYVEVYGEQEEEQTMACVHVLSYENDKMVITGYDYDGDAKDMFEMWELPVSADVKFKSVTVTVTNGEEKVETQVLTKDDIVSEDNSGWSGFITVNREGEIDNFVIYGSIEIWE